MKILKSYVLLCSLFLLILTGCNSNDGSAYVDKLVGVWKVDPDSRIARSTHGPNRLNPSAIALAQKLSAMNINLKPDMTFDANITVAISGTWTVDGSGLVTMNSTNGSLSTVNGGVNLYCQFDEAKNILTQQNNSSGEVKASDGFLAFSKQ